MKNFQEFLNEEYKESENDSKFEVGDEVFVKGIVGFHNFNKKGIIINKRFGACFYQRPNHRYERYQREDNLYYGNIYYIDTIKYWVPTICFN